MKENKKLIPEEQTTIDYYNTHALEWAQKHGLTDNESWFKQEMKKMFEIIPQGKVIEVGPGHGGDAIKLIEHYGDNNYVGCDASSGLLKIAKGRLPQADFKNLTIYELAQNFSQDSFDAFWVCAVLVHTPKSRLQEALYNLHYVTKTGGIGFISIMEGNSDMEEGRPGRYFSLWQQDEFESELKQSGLKEISKRKIEQESGSPWLAYLVEVV